MMISSVYKSVNFRKSSFWLRMGNMTHQKHLSVETSSSLKLPQKEILKRERLSKRYSNEIESMNNDSTAERSTEALLSDFSKRSSSSLDLQKLLLNKEVDEEWLLKSSQFLSKELPIRIAQKVQELSSLPHNLHTRSAIKEVRKMYEKTFSHLIHLQQPSNFSDERRFTNHLKEIYERHSGVLWTVARGVFQLKVKHKKTEHRKFSLEDNFPGIESFLHDFFLSRLDIRMLIGQHIALHEHIDGWLGLFCLKTSPTEIATSAIRAATNSCFQYYTVVPNVRIEHIESQPLDNFPYIPAFLHHILFELLKNSMRATIETHGLSKSSTESSSFDFPEIVVRIGSEAIEVVDSGGGFDSDKEVDRAWSYMYTTASETDCVHLFNELDRSFGRDFDSNELGLPLAGLGFGLPIAQVFAEFLGGRITLVNSPGVGATASFCISSGRGKF